MSLSGHGRGRDNVHSLAKVCATNNVNNINNGPPEGRFFRCRPRTQEEEAALEAKIWLERRRRAERANAMYASKVQKSTFGFGGESGTGVGATLATTMGNGGGASDAAYRSFTGGSNGESGYVAYPLADSTVTTTTFWDSARRAITIGTIDKAVRFGPLHEKSTRPGFTRNTAAVADNYVSQFWREMNDILAHLRDDKPFGVRLLSRHKAQGSRLMAIPAGVEEGDGNAGNAGEAGAAGGELEDEEDADYGAMADDMATTAEQKSAFALRIRCEWSSRRCQSFVPEYNSLPSHSRKEDVEG